jgi:hypothetical protein
MRIRNEVDGGSCLLRKWVAGPSSRQVTGQTGVRAEDGRCFPVVQCPTLLLRGLRSPVLMLRLRR